MSLIDDLLKDLPEGKVIDVRIGLRWTAVVIQKDELAYCGLASTVTGPATHNSQPLVPLAGQLNSLTGHEMAALANSTLPVERSLGVAAINALLPQSPTNWTDINAEEVIARHGEAKKVALIGSFPFIPRLRDRVGQLIVLEQNPIPGELPSSHAPDIIPAADVVAITGMALVNNTLEEMLHLCRPDSIVLVLGPSTPLSPILYDYGVSLISGSVVTNISAVLQSTSQGANFRQLHTAGIRLVTMS